MNCVVAVILGFRGHNGRHLKFSYYCLPCYGSDLNDFFYHQFQMRLICSSMFPLVSLTFPDVLVVRII